jgi:uncharacterized glyoxalase superfamily protein PhnB
MMRASKNSADTASASKALIPTVAYRDAPAMIDWLAKAYGFEKRRTVEDEAGRLRCAVLAFGGSTLLVVPAQDAAFERLLVHPDQIGGVETQACHLIVPDIDAHCAKAAAKGAEIVAGLGAGEHCGRTYTSRDPEGHIWIFGSRHPDDRRGATEGRRRARPRMRVPMFVSASLVLAAVAVAAALASADMRRALKLDAAGFAIGDRSAADDVAHDRNRARDVRETRADATERSVSELAERLARTRAALESAVRSEKEAHVQLAREVRAREGLARSAKQTGDMLDRERAAREAAEKAVRDATGQLTRVEAPKTTATGDACESERRLRILAEHSMQAAQVELASERSAKAAAEIATSELRNQLIALGPIPPATLALREQVEAERRARERSERAAKDVQLQLAQEKHSRDATERALRHAEDRLAAASCWACPSGAPCSRPQ